MPSLQLATLQSYLSHLVGVRGVRAAALVEPESGMVVLHEGNVEDLDRLAEVAVDFWRLHARQRERFSKLGALTGISVSYERLSLKLQPTPPSVAQELIAVLVLDWSGDKRAG
jgi:predicted regulator of Ras-like GTPase activity (Roadblock/LC7/MglB family)